jgi:hypothetical protein
MILIEGGTFLMGSDRHYPEEAPQHRVTVGSFFIDPMPVTNRQFAEFVTATGYITVAERQLNPEDYPGAAPEMLAPGALVFHKTPGPVNARPASSSRGCHPWRAQSAVVLSCQTTPTIGSSGSWSSFTRRGRWPAIQSMFFHRHDRVAGNFMASGHTPGPGPRRPRRLQTRYASRGVRPGRPSQCSQLGPG